MAFGYAQCAEAPQGKGGDEMDLKDGLNALLPVARTMLGLDSDELERLGPVDLTILFTDIENYSRAADKLGDESAHEIVRAHNRIVRRALRRYGGHEVKHTGDGIMAYFLAAGRALAAAVEIERRIEEHNRRGQGPQLQVRIGINSGEPIVERGDLYGTPVIVASRIVDLAGGEQILVSDVVRQLAAGKGFVFRPLGRVQLEGIRDPVRLYEVDWRQSRLPEPEPKAKGARD
ncbi:MAG: adenylate/guanylate cyclase domain-containing protein [Candidatus Dadabacteria bacterium]|nr:MAG: adenylate/guanylate cyclase domain-containing protein [Candidatus Dadabacteria bacterium]